MAIAVRCDCGKQLKVKDELAGRRVKCPECDEVLTIPDINESVQASRPVPKAVPPRPRDEAGFDEDEEEERPRRRRDAVDLDEEDDEKERPRRRRRNRGGAGRLSRKDLHGVAIYQKVVIICVACYLGAVIGQFFIPSELRIFLGLAMIPVAITAAVFVFMLSIKVYSVGLGVALAFLVLIPCLGLIMLLVINQKATALLKERGYDVGLFGADLSQFG